MGLADDDIDFAAEEDYEGRDWFQDRPARPEKPPVPPSTSTNYQPLPGVIEQNDMFIHALRAAHLVLYERFKQFGQLGVLGWCAEFSELVDSLKQLGFAGNMFVGTRQEALAACQAILRLNLDIKMQIIIMYLSSQVARMRRFLDGDQEFNDYPVPEFPLNPYEQ